MIVKVHCCLPFEPLGERSLQREGGACGLLAAQRWHAVRGAIMQSASAALSHLDIVDSTVPDLPGAHSATGQHRGGEDGWNSSAAARQTSELGDPDDEVLEFLTPARKEAILTGISEMLEIMKERSLDSMKTDMIRRMLCSGTVDLTVMECFLGDGQWNPEMSRFDGAPDWDEVQRALEALRESVLEEHLTVRPNTQPMLCNTPALPGAGGSGVRHPSSSAQIRIFGVASRLQDGGGTMIKCDLSQRAQCCNFPSRAGGVGSGRALDRVVCEPVSSQRHSALPPAPRSSSARAGVSGQTRVLAQAERCWVESLKHRVAGRMLASERLPRALLYGCAR